MRASSSIALTLISIFSAACSSSSPETTAPPAPLPGPSAWNRLVTPPPDAQATMERAACGYKAGALPAETQGASTPNGADIPVDHVVVMMMENRSFDHYFQDLPANGQPDVEVAPATFSNPDTDKNPFPIFHDSTFCFVDTNHEWAGSHQEVNGGKMDGFYAANEGWHELPAHGTLDLLSGSRAMGYYSATDLPFYYWVANEFAIADHYHCALQGPTWPNRMYLYAATSFGETTNSVPTADKTLMDYLEQRQVDWKIYTGGTAGFSMFVEEFINFNKLGRILPLAQYYVDAAAGTLPSVAFIDPTLGEENYNQDDEHPPAIGMIGEALTAKVVDALTKSPAWSRSAMFITYDEHGGLYDHVVPPPACEPDDIAPILQPGDPVAKFDQYGVRVPLMVISPFAKKHYVAHDIYDHTSIVRFIEARFVMPALTNRDANAEIPWEMFDFPGAPHATPPTVTIPTVNQSKIDACAKIYEQ